MPTIRLTPAEAAALERTAGARVTGVRLPGDPPRARRPRPAARPAKLIAPQLVVEAVLPLVTRNESNSYGRDWRDRNRRKHLAQQAWDAILAPIEAWNMLPCTVTLTRLGGKRLDKDDNLPSAMKGLKDHVAKDLGVDDADERVTWKYAQEVGGSEYGVRVTICKEF